MADGIDILLAAANGAREERQKSADVQNRTTQTMLDALQKNRQLGLMERETNVQEKTLSLKEQELMIEKTKAERMNDILGNILSGGSGSAPPGTTYSYGGLRFPVNPKLTDTEQSSIAGADKFEPLVKEIDSLISKGVFKDKGIERSYQQWLAEGGGSPIKRFLTEDNSDLETLASTAAEMKKFAFAEGGKQLSPTEKKVVEAGLSFFGKSDEAIKRDFSAAIDIIRQKKELALGGANAVSKKVNEQKVNKLPPKESAPKGAKGWDTEKGEWVF